MLSAAACGGGGGGGNSTNLGPTIVTAAFVGANATPQAGETLLLFFSEAVQLQSGALLTDADVTLSGGGTLGSVAGAPVLSNSQLVSITLGSGVTFTPGTTTITLSTGNDVVKDATGKLGEASTAVTIGTSDGQQPTIDQLTIADIDAELNGSGPAGGTLQVPQNGWSIDLVFADNGTVDVNRTLIYANVSVGTASGTKPAGTNLTPFLTLAGSTATTASFTVPATVTVPQGLFTLTGTVIDTSGLASTAATFRATARAFNDSLRPFETNVNSSQVWFLDFSRDVESFSTSPSGSGVAVNAQNGANGRSDFEDILRIIGLNNAAPIANVSGSRDSNEVAQDTFKTRVLSDLSALYSGANVSFTLTQPSGTFNGSSSLSYSSFGYSQISVAGAASTPGVLGIAIFDPSNTTQDDNTQTNFGGIRLGVFLHTLVDDGLRSASTSQFRQTFDALVPAFSGTPIGSDASDGARLTGALNDSRTTLIDTAINDFARFTAVVIAHECGHSLGLVENGAMPAGLYGDDTVNFPGSSDGHIRNTSLFPSGATNVMSPSLTYSSTVHPASAFNTLNLAYLREQVFYGN